MEQVFWDTVADAIRNHGVLSREIEQHVETGDGNLKEAMKTLVREISDLKGEESRLVGLYQKDFIDEDILEHRISPLKLMRTEKEQALGALKEQQRNVDAASVVKEQIEEYCRRISESLDDLDFEGKRAVMAAMGVRGEVTEESLSITMVVDPSVTTVSPSSPRTWSSPNGSTSSPTQWPRRRPSTGWSITRSSWNSTSPATAPEWPSSVVGNRG